MTIDDTSATLIAGADQVTVGYKATEASATVDVNTKVTASAGSDDFTVKSNRFDGRFRKSS